MTKPKFKAGRPMINADLGRMRGLSLPLHADTLDRVRRCASRANAPVTAWIRNAVELQLEKQEKTVQKVLDA